MTRHSMEEFEAKVAEAVKEEQVPVKPRIELERRPITRERVVPQGHACDCTAHRYDQIVNGR